MCASVPMAPVAVGAWRVFPPVGYSLPYCDLFAFPICGHTNVMTARSWILYIISRMHPKICWQFVNIPTEPTVEDADFLTRFLCNLTRTKRRYNGSGRFCPLQSRWIVEKNIVFMGPLQYAPTQTFVHFLHTFLISDLFRIFLLTLWENHCII